MGSLNLVGLATVSVGFITAAYYILPSVSRYFLRVFATRTEKRSEDTSLETSLVREDYQPTYSQPELNANGVIPQSKGSEGCTRSGLKPADNLRVGKVGRNGVTPHGFERFIRHDVIMKFEGQRQVKFQFFVVVLASEDDLRNLQCMTFHPHDTLSPGQPLINNQELTMPMTNNYGNYIVARFESCAYHSEEVVFGPKYDNPFSQLWSAYSRRNGGRRPKAIILYSWNFPCGRCTNLMVNELSQPEYSGSHVMLTYSRIWDSEEGYPHVADRNMEMWKERTGAHIQHVEPPVSLQEARLSPT